jgi:membrane-associated protein
LGYFFGNIPFVQENFELVIVAIIVISLVPAVMEALKVRKEMREPQSAGQKLDEQEQVS